MSARVPRVKRRRVLDFRRSTDFPPLSGAELQARVDDIVFKHDSEDISVHRPPASIVVPPACRPAQLKLPKGLEDMCIAIAGRTTDAPRHALSFWGVWFVVAAVVRFRRPLRRQASQLKEVHARQKDARLRAMATATVRPEDFGVFSERITAGRSTLTKAVRASAAALLVVQAKGRNTRDDPLRKPPVPSLSLARTTNADSLWQSDSAARCPVPPPVTGSTPRPSTQHGSSIARCREQAARLQAMSARALSSETPTAASAGAGLVKSWRRPHLTLGAFLKGPSTPQEPHASGRPSTDDAILQQPTPRHSAGPDPPIGLGLVAMDISSSPMGADADQRSAAPAPEMQSTQQLSLPNLKKLAIRQPSTGSPPQATPGSPFASSLHSPRQVPLPFAASDSPSMRDEPPFGTSLSAQAHSPDRSPAFGAFSSNWLTAESALQPTHHTSDGEDDPEPASEDQPSETVEARVDGADDGGSPAGHQRNPRVVRMPSRRAAFRPKVEAVLFSNREFSEIPIPRPTPHPSVAYPPPNRSTITSPRAEVPRNVAGGVVTADESRASFDRFRAKLLRSRREYHNDELARLKMAEERRQQALPLKREFLLYECEHDQEASAPEVQVKLRCFVRDARLQTAHDADLTKRTDWFFEFYQRVTDTCASERVSEVLQRLQPHFQTLEEDLLTPLHFKSLVDRTEDNDLMTQEVQFVLRHVAKAFKVPYVRFRELLELRHVHFVLPGSVGD